MLHSISLTCVRYRLRPVTIEDASFIVALRTDELRNRFVHEISSRIEDQVAWLEGYFERAGDYYFIVENADSSEPQGTIGLHDATSESDCTEWGRWILRRGSMAALESAWLIHEVGLSKLHLASLRSRTLAENRAVLSFLDSFGASRSNILEAHFTIRGEPKTVVEHRITAADWPKLRAQHYSTASRLACYVRR